MYLSCKNLKSLNSDQNTLIYISLSLGELAINENIRALELKRTYITPIKAAKMLGMNIKTIRKYLREGALPGGIKIGRHYRINMFLFEQHLARLQNEESKN